MTRTCTAVHVHQTGVSEKHGRARASSGALHGGVKDSVGNAVAGGAPQVLLAAAWVLVGAAWVGGLAAALAGGPLAAGGLSVPLQGDLAPMR